MLNSSPANATNLDWSKILLHGRAPQMDKRSKILTLSQTTNFRLFQTERVCRQKFEI